MMMETINNTMMNKSTTTKKDVEIVDQKTVEYNTTNSKLQKNAMFLTVSMAKQHLRRPDTDSTGTQFEWMLVTVQGIKQPLLSGPITSFFPTITKPLSRVPDTTVPTLRTLHQNKQTNKTKQTRQ
jgi:hypothetical protein